MFLLIAEILIEAERDAREAHARAVERWFPLPSPSPSPFHPLAAGAHRAGRLLVRGGTRLETMSGGVPARTLVLVPEPESGGKQ